MMSDRPGTSTLYNGENISARRVNPVNLLVVAVSRRLYVESCAGDRGDYFY